MFIIIIYNIYITNPLLQNIAPERAKASLQHLHMSSYDLIEVLRLI